jgi:dolichyl-phosphate-mannose--protein O-mannosyl transferase
MTLVDRAIAVRDRVALLTPRVQALVLYSPILVVAALIRLINLGSPRALVFDEVYYVRDAWTLWNLGYESEWADDSDFVGGSTSAFTTGPSFIAHPPLGKWLIGAGMALFGPDNAFGWRFATAIAGIAVVLLIMLIARRLFRSRFAAALAGLIVALDGVAITMSRTALLDGILAAFILAAFLVILRHFDRPGWGQWLILAGALLGAATAVKWSGLYAFAVLGAWIAVDAILRDRSWVAAWPIARAALLALPVAAITYLASWSGWLFSSGGYNRQVVTLEGNPIGSALESLWTYHHSIFEYNIGLVSPHGYQANPFTWLLMIRPTAFYYEQTGIDGIVQYVTSVANPIFWYFGVVALVWLVVHTIRTRSTWGVPVLVGVAATYLPWLFFAHRTVFQFYTVTLEPFLALAAVWLFVRLWRAGRETVVTGLVVAGVAVGAFFLPVWMGLPIPIWFAAAHYWFPWWI